MGKLVLGAVIAMLAVVAWLTGAQSLNDEPEQGFTTERTGPASPVAEAPAAESPAKPQAIDASDLDDADTMIAAAINLNGYLCAKPIEIQEADTDLYGVQCVTNRNGTGRSNYLVNSRTGEVTPI